MMYPNIVQGTGVETPSLSRQNLARDEIWRSEPPLSWCVSPFTTDDRPLHTSYLQEDAHHIHVKASVVSNSYRTISIMFLRTTASPNSPLTHHDTTQRIMTTCARTRLLPLCVAGAITSW
jgi:hypothetical protein